jgi:hypothetical protein
VGLFGKLSLQSFVGSPVKPPRAQHLPECHSASYQHRGPHRYNNRDALVISDHSPPQFSPTDPLQKAWDILQCYSHTCRMSFNPTSSSILPRLHLYSASKYFRHPTQALPLPHTMGNRLTSLVTFFPNILISSKQVVTLI